jgi:SHS2 domain-containing protein
MNFHQITVHVDGRDLESIVKEGVLATVEVGTHVDRVTKPETRVLIVTGRKDGKPVAWVQVAYANGIGALHISHEGWVSDGCEELSSSASGSPIRAKLKLVKAVPDKSRDSIEKAQFGVTACCTSYGKGCYVKCCGGCCKDPVKCPGAGCCP